eukprot:4366135-Alexandrium_andersonii.AAC.1
MGAQWAPLAARMAAWASAEVRTRTPLVPTYEPRTVRDRRVPGVETAAAGVDAMASRGAAPGLMVVACLGSTNEARGDVS